MAERRLVFRFHLPEDGALQMAQQQRVPQIFLDEWNEHVRLQPAEVRAEHVGDQLVADDERILALAADLAPRTDEPVRKRFDRLGNDGQIKPRGQFLHPGMEIVGEQTELNTCGASLRKPCLNIGGHRMVIARQDGVIDIAQNVRETAAEQIPLDIDTGYTGKVPVRLEENRDPRPDARLDSA